MKKRKQKEFGYIRSYEKMASEWYSLAAFLQMITPSMRKFSSYSSTKFVREHFEVMDDHYRPDDVNAKEEVWIPIKNK
ncbi:hypothetical protein V7166_07845 [Bacillus thuringiensis]